MAASPDERNLQTQLQTLEEKEQQTKAKLARLDQERAAAQATLEHLEERKQSTLKVLLGRLRKRYLSRLLGAKAIKVKAAKTSGVDQSTLGKITTIPKIASRFLNEIEIQPILKNYSYVRILYDTLSSEYFYEVIEPKLLPEEEELLTVLKEILVESLELLPDATVPEKEKYLRRIVEGLPRELNIPLRPPAVPRDRRRHDRHERGGRLVRRGPRPLLHLPPEVRIHPVEPEVRDKRGARRVRRLAP